MESGRSLPRKVTSEIRRSSRAARKTKDIVKADLPEVLITGCRDTQTSADAFINGRYNGALTYALVEAMRKGKGALTYKQLHDRAHGVLKAKKFDQVPQLEGRTDRFDTPAVFSVRCTMSRPDQSITFLRGYGFSVFRFPRASAQPLELMHRDGKDLTRLGMVPDLVTAGEIAPPDVRRDASPGIDIEGKETSKVNVAIGLSILGSFIGALGGGKLGLDVAFN